MFDEVYQLFSNYLLRTKHQFSLTICYNNSNIILLNEFNIK